LDALLETMAERFKEKHRSKAELLMSGIECSQVAISFTLIYEREDDCRYLMFESQAEYPQHLLRRKLASYISKEGCGMICLDHAALPTHFPAGRVELHERIEKFGSRGATHLNF
jgi:hypothetical protein